MKRILLFAVLMMAVALPYAAGQGAASSTGHFEWAKGYDSGFDDAYIVGTVTDSLGNLYILGQIHYDSDWDYTESVAPPLSTQNTMVLVAKISPEGEMVWKKMFGNDVSHTYANDIKPLGDTGFAVMFEDGMIVPGYGSRYWGDSMRNDVNHPLISPCDTPGLRFSDGRPTIFISFDFDGNVIEQHALEITFLDSDGNDFERSMYQSPDSLPRLRTSSMYLTTFDVDNDGNIYVCYRPGDFPDSANYANYDRLAATRYWVDHRLVGESTLGNNTTEESLPYPQLVKFSPHFDTVLASRYIVQQSNARLHSAFPHLKFDKSVEYLYSMLHVEFVSGTGDFFLIDSVSDLYVHPHGSTFMKSFVTIFDSFLSPVYLIELNDGIIDSNGFYGNTVFKDIAFDYDSNIVAISCIPGINNGYFLYNGHQLSLTNKEFVILLNKDDYTLHSIMTVPSTGEAGLSSNKSYGNLALKNNRVYIQAMYKNKITLPSGQYFVNGNQKYGLSLVIWDYQGNLIDGHEYHTYSALHSPGPINLIDTTLYLVNHLNANATFGNIQYNVMSYAACVAKYVDPAFMDVYQPVGIAEVDAANHTIYPNPVESLLHVRLDGDNILQATAISVLGTKEQLDAVGNTVDVSRLQSGIYIMELTTVHGTNHFKFIKQ